MSWRDELHLDGKGSFRGVEFYVPRASSEVGRRTVIHRYPGRDDPGTEDNGREPREFTLDCFLLGDNYMSDRDRLWAAIEKKGPGELTHPYWGKFNVVIRGKVRFEETTADGGMARFSLPVLEVGKTLSPVVEPDTSAEIDTAATAAVAAATTEFEDDFTVIGYIADVLQASVNLVNAVVSDLNKVKGYVNAAMAAADEIGEAIETLADTVTSLVLLPGQLVASLQSIVEGVTGAIASIGDAWDSYFTDDESVDSVVGSPVSSPTAAAPIDSDARVDLLMRAWRDLQAFGNDFATVPVTTPQRVQEGTNQAAFVTLIRALGTIEAARTLGTLPFTSATKVESVREELFEALDNLLDEADDALYHALMNLRVGLTEHFQSVAEDLPRVVEYVPSRTLPALVISQQLYGDASHETELIWRNGLRNPCLVSAGAVLEVLADA